LDKEVKNNDGIIYPRRGKGEPDLAPDALMVMIPSELRYLVKVPKAEELSFDERMRRWA